MTLSTDNSHDETHPRSGHHVFCWSIPLKSETVDLFTEFYVWRDGDRIRYCVPDCCVLRARQAQARQENKL